MFGAAKAIIKAIIDRRRLASAWAGSDHLWQNNPLNLLPPPAGWHQHAMSAACLV